MQNGRVVGDGAPSEVINGRLLSEVFRVEGDVIEIDGRRVVSVAPVSLRSRSGRFDGPAVVNGTDIAGEIVGV